MAFESESLLADDPDDRALLAQVHPENWAQPAAQGIYNLVVLGGGTAGLVSAAAAAGLGAKVALVEKNLLGGDCLNVGCVPSKMLLSAGRAVAAVRASREHGIHVGEPVVDFGAVMARLRRLRSRIAHNDSATRFKSIGVDVFLGTGKFSGPASLQVGGQTIHFAKAIVATGARALMPPIPGLREAGALTNETVFRLTKLPERLAVLGGGPIGCELAQAFARLGSKVWQIDLAGHLLPREDADAAALVQDALIKDGVQLHLNSNIERVETIDGSSRLFLKTPQGQEILEVDAILVGVGRAPNIEGLGLEDAGVSYSKQGVTVDSRLRSSNSRIYAAGDVCSPYKFTHAADFMARTAIQNALFMGRKKAPDLLIPWSTYTSPEVAHVGLYEAEAEAQGLKIQTIVKPFKDVDRAIASGREEGFVKIHALKGSGKIVGATIVSEHAGDLISEIAVAMRAGMGLGTLASVIHPYPTLAEAIRHCGDQFNRTKLTPGIARILKSWLKWQRR